METIAKIKAEIERNRQAIRVLNEHTAPEQMSKTCAIFQYSDTILSDLLTFLSTLESEKQEVDLEKFTEKMDAWKARYNHPDNIPIKATMAFTARMFYMYPKVAREWYDNLSKVTQD